MLILSRKCGESILLGEDIQLVVLEIAGDKIKLGIEAPKSVKVLRGELLQTMESNRQAASSVVSKQALARYAAGLLGKPPAPQENDPSV